MGKCKYCGQSAGIFSHAHKECEEKHSKGLTGMEHLMGKYFSGGVSASDLASKLSRNKPAYYLTDDDIADIAATAITSFGNTLRRPYSGALLSKIKDFIAAVPVSYTAINKNGALDNLAKKLFQGYVVDFFARGVPLSQIQVSTDSVTSVLPMTSQQKNDAYINVLGKAADKFLADGMLTDREQQQIELYASSLGIALNCLPSQHQNESLARIGQAMILKDLQNGIMPKNPLTVPVMLGRGEVAIWVYDNVTMYQEKFIREYQGGSRGVSYRICKGVTYRTGSFKGRPVERSSMECVGTGSLVITNKHFFFHCPTASVKIPYSKLVGVTPYSDGLEVHKEEAKPKRTVFQGFDAWFVMNVLNLVNNV